MKNGLSILTLLLAFTFFASAQSCCQKKDAKCANKTSQTLQNSADAKVMVYYFHSERRCATCIAVGEVAQSFVAEKYKDSKDVVFKKVDISKDENKALAKKHKIASSGLVVCNAGSSKDITAFAFQNARNNPDKLKAELSKLVSEKLK